MEKNTNVEPTATSVAARKSYAKPQLVEYGRVGELTKGGATTSSFEGGLYTSAS